MNDFLGGKNKNSIKMLWIGMVILAICLAVCIFMVSFLKGAYESEVVSDFITHHESIVDIIDEQLDGLTEISDATVTFMENEVFFPSDAKIQEILSLYRETEEISDIIFVSSLGKVYTNDKIYSLDNMKQEISIYDEIIASISAEDTASRVDTMHSVSANGNEASYIVISKPVFYRNQYSGHIIAAKDVTDLFSQKVFELQNTIGECYLIDKAGNIVVKSSDSIVALASDKNFIEAVKNYSDGKTASDKNIKLLESDIKAGKSVNTVVKTKDGYELMVLTSPLNSFDGLYYGSCYKDDIIEDKIQPLIFRSVISCIAIIFLMIIIIVYVWATAKRANITIEKLAYMDPVTEGKNINFFKEFSVRAMATYKETPFVIYRFDILNFRYVNEAYGHTKADGVLKACIASFEEVFTEKELCVRMNADQFLAIIVNDNALDQRIKMFSAKVNENARGLGIKYPIRFKFGICQVRKHEHDIDVLIDHANVARKTLNGDEKETKAVYSEKIVNDMRKIDRIESEQQRALATEEFKVFLQPKWNIKENHVAGAEALVRWIKADGSMVYPDEFIPVFENNGFVEKLDFFMLEKVCMYIRELIEAGKPVYPVSINQSRLLLHSTDYVKNVEKIIKQNNIPAGIIELEITETVFENESDAMINITNELKKIGIKLSMDDFGSGYSSLNMLKDVPFDIIKIDREFFSESVTSENSLLILQKIVEMADGLGMDVICEGVETGEQVVILQTIGVKLVQGYYYSKPISADEFFKLYCNN